ncbi:hypothetical protein DERF_001571 [Dermatophagoides farinae]|uniref:Uncharacterized protein n=1 Tax=Dermatophagoides farinae TaxID=6954 RepID=A0A922LBA8_DERFA|nr:hypothetical protein DERF_001571 [Dermatophagoides farinae]
MDDEAYFPNLDDKAFKGFKNFFFFLLKTSGTFQKKIIKVVKGNEKKKILDSELLKLNTLKISLSESANLSHKYLNDEEDSTVLVVN